MLPARRWLWRTAWVRAMPPAQRMTAAYMTLRNTGDAPVVVESVRSEGAAEASLHATRRDGDRVRMEAIDKLTVDPGATVELAPGRNACDDHGNGAHAGGG